MTNQQILVQAARITLTYKPLWWLGIFLSSGFNFHAWYGVQWLSQNRFAQIAADQLILLSSSMIALLLTAGFIIGLLLVNFMKLVFFAHVHSELHDAKLGQCLFCNEVKEQSVWRAIKNNPKLWLRTVGASLLTITSTLSVIGLFHFYATHSEFQFLKSALMIVSLVVVLIAISWWNLLVVLFMMWYRQNFWRSAGLAVELLINRFRQVAVITILSTAIFIVSLVAGSVIIMQIPNMLAATPNLLFTPAVFDSWRILVNLVTAVIFVIWLVLNNIWFNVVMALLFDNLVKLPKSIEPVTFLAKQPEPLSHLHHIVDKMRKM
ncbi:MAG TPA: hypothetical protein PKD79_01570 [Candidatus Doudnabacteria bacterium]|nr:hypothetical protein [Candidatus Doudnabacteria bacterium]